MLAFAQNPWTRHVKVGKVVAATIDVHGILDSQVAMSEGRGFGQLKGGGIIEVRLQ